jgi:putative membrane protein
LLLLAAVIAYSGAREVLSALAAGGSGLLLVAAFHVFPLWADALGWRRLVLRPENRPPASTMAYLRWLGESVNSLVPVLQLGGNIVKAIALSRRGVQAEQAAATVVVDMTLVLLTQALFTLVGLGLLLAQPGSGQMAVAAGLGLLVMGLLLAGFVAAQRQGLFSALAGLMRRARRGGTWPTFAVRASAIDAAAEGLYGEPRALAAAGAWHLLSWVIGAGEVWLALAVLGHPVSLTTAVLLESLGQAVRVAAFAVPGALGVQEGGFVLLGGAVGLTPDVALAVSLAKRVRELVLGLPGLLAWQIEETRVLAVGRWARRRSG